MVQILPAEFFKVGLLENYSIIYIKKKEKTRDIHQSGGCLVGGALCGILRGSLIDSLEFVAFSLSLFFSVLACRSSFTGGRSEDFNLTISSSASLNTLRIMTYYIRHILLRYSHTQNLR